MLAALGADALAIIPAAYGVAVIDHMLDEFDTLVLLKVKPMLDEVLELLTQRGLLATTCFIEKVGSPDERIVRGALQDIAALVAGAGIRKTAMILVGPALDDSSQAASRLYAEDFSHGCR